MTGIGIESLYKVVLNHLENERSAELKQLLIISHPADIAEIIQLLPNYQRKIILKLLGHEFNPDILSYLEESIRDDIIDSFVETELTNVLQQIDESDAIEILESLDKEERHSLLCTLKPDVRAILEDGLSYQDDTAGRIMSYDFIALPASLTVDIAIKFIKTSIELPEGANEIFIVNEKRAPISYITFSSLIQAQPEQTLMQLGKSLISITNVSIPIHEICLVFQKYLINALPVVSRQGKIVGVINANNMLDIIAADSQESFLQSSGVSTSDFYESLFVTFQSRVKWILITGIYACLAAFITYRFSKVIQANIIIAPMLQVVMALCATSGLQVSTVTIRALLEKHILFANIKRAIVKEFIVGACNGAVCGFAFSLLLIIFSFLIPIPLLLCCITYAAIFFSMMFINVVGFLLPVLLEKIGIDPAISSGPLISSISDACCNFVLLGLTSYLF